MFKLTTFFCALAVLPATLTGYQFAPTAVNAYPETPTKPVANTVYRQAPRADIVYQQGTPTAVAPHSGSPHLFVAPETATSPTGEMVGEPVFAMEPEYYESNFNATDIIQINSYYSRRMLDVLNRQTDKQLLVLDNEWESGSPSLIIGGQMRASFLAASTNRANKFPYQGRFPSDFSGTTATDARILQANLGATAHVNSLAHGYGELLFSDVFTFPAFNQGSFQVRQAYIVIGDRNRSPFYGFIGKKNVSFGDMRTLNPFSQSMVWHYFNALAEGIGGGYQSGNFHWSITGINGGRGIRVADSPQRGRINNFAGNGTFCLCDGPTRKFEIGAGYLHGTIYDALEPDHIEPDIFGARNPAWDINTRLRYDSWQFSGEFASTVNPWPATKSRVNAWRAETAVNIWAWGLPAALSAGWSEGNQGPAGSQYEFNRQFVLGLGVSPNINTQLSLEYVLSSGFAPLRNITTSSDRNVQQHSAVLGLVLVL